MSEEPEEEYNIDEKITLITDKVLPSEISNYHGKGIEKLADKNGNRVYSDIVLQEIMNTVIEFILANSHSKVNQNLIKSAIKRLCRDELNNRLHEDGRLQNWEQIDVMNKEYLMKMLEEKVESAEPTETLFVFPNVK